MAAVTSPPLPVEEYLHDPRYKHHEYVDGEAVALHLGSKKHGRIQGRCFRAFDEYFDTHPDGYVGTEIHCRLQISGVPRFRLPDVAVVLGERFGQDGYLVGAPDLVIEIRSPEDTVSSQIAKLRDYFANGCKLAWLVLPEEESVLIFQPDGIPSTVQAGQSLTGGQLLPGFHVSVDFLLG